MRNLPVRTTAFFIVGYSGCEKPAKEGGKGQNHGREYKMDLEMDLVLEGNMIGLQSINPKSSKEMLMFLWWHRIRHNCLEPSDAPCVAS